MSSWENVHRHHHHHCHSHRYSHQHLRHHLANLTTITTYSITAILIIITHNSPEGNLWYHVIITISQTLLSSSSLSSSSPSSSSSSSSSSLSLPHDHQGTVYGLFVRSSVSAVSLRLTVLQQAFPFPQTIPRDLIMG